MFHRVKSEGQNAQPETTNETQTAETGSEHNNEETQNGEYENNYAQNTTQIEDENAMTNDSTAENADLYEETPSTFSYRNRPAGAPSSSKPTIPTGGYPGSAPSYGGPASYGIAAGRENRSGGSMDRRLTIGAGITMSGEIESCDYLLVEGTVEAALKGANVLEIAESGVFYGTVEIGEANIAGRFEGDITVHGRLTISSSGTVTGSIVYKELELEAGAIIDGKLTPLSAVSTSAQAPAPASRTGKTQTKKSAPAKAKTTETRQQEPANSDVGLFSKTAAE